MIESHRETIQELGIPKALRHYIAGGFRAEAKRTLPAVDPTTQEIITEIPQATEGEIETAVQAAVKAQAEWSNASPGRRRKTLLGLVEALKKREKDLPRIEAVDVGMPRVVSQQFSSRAMLRHLEYYAEWADKVGGHLVPSGASAESLNYVVYEPVGVVVAIVPWNSPFLFFGSKVAPALAAGCSIILKPSELASVTAHTFAEAVHEAGLPAGLVQVLYGDGDVGRRLTLHPAVNKVAFTGGTGKGRDIMAQASGTLKRVSLELGGKSPNIVFEDADLSRATMMSTYGMFSLTGQACVAASRLFVHRNLAEGFVRGIVNFAQTLQVGDPLDGSVMLGPLISNSHLERVDSFVRDAKGQGARVLCGGEPARVGKGNFYPPTVLTGVDPKSRAAQEEIFGPVMCVFEFDTEEEVVARANETIYGLGAAVWTKDISRALRVAARLQAGTVWVNAYGTLPIQSPFGGYKQSGFGRDGGVEGILEYLQPKNVFVQL
ncbi:MAG: aldehyde dehydrogenase [Nitrospirae bacterium]|nr:aldehyde dehydrogenase [Nitrospirota bacterium]